MKTKKNGKILHDDHYKILRELGIDINNVSYETTTEDVIATQSGGMHQGTMINKITFTVAGEINDGIDVEKLHEIMLVLVAAKNSNSPAVMDLYDQLRTILGLTQ